MVFDHQSTIRGRMACETGHHLGQEGNIVGEMRVPQQLGIALALETGQKEWTARGDLLGVACLSGPERKSDVAPDVTGTLQPWGLSIGCDKSWEQQSTRHLDKVIEADVDDVVRQDPPHHSRYRHLRDGRRIGVPRARQPARRVHAIAFDGDPVGSKIAVLKDPHPGAEPIGLRKHALVIRSTLAEDHNVGEGWGEFEQAAGPISGITLERDTARAPAVEQVAGIEDHP